MEQLFLQRFPAHRREILPPAGLARVHCQHLCRDIGQPIDEIMLDLFDGLFLQHFHALRIGLGAQLLHAHGHGEILVDQQAGIFISY
ncbi:MAG: hypothetical protein WDN72_05950 [Alphaproteobacteria bacterium]